MLKRIEGTKVKLTRMALQLVDQSIKCTYGVIEDVHVHVDKFTFLMDFVILYIEEDTKVPLILGRPFMKAAKVIIYVDNDKLKIRDQKEEVNFKMYEGIHNLQPKDISAAKEVLFVTSKPEQVSRLLKTCSHCFSPQQMKEEEKGPPPEKKKGRAIRC